MELRVSKAAHLRKQVEVSESNRTTIVSFQSAEPIIFLAVATENIVKNCCSLSQQFKGGSASANPQKQASKPASKQASLTLFR
jgi:hypothetical protein